MHESKEEIPVPMEGEELRGLGMNSTNQGGMVVNYNEMPAGTDFTPALKGLPDDLCQCPHWGYVLEGSVHVRYADGHEEVARAGEVFYWPPGHTVWFEEDTRFVNVQPEDKFKEVHDYIQAQIGSTGIRNSEVKGATMNVNGTDIYHEVRGSGPSVLFISGATGDAGHFEKVAELLSNEFTVVTYDRRANSRSPRPVGWDSTSTEQQADDAAGLIEALGLAPAAVFGTSSGAIIGLNLVIRRPEIVRGAILHEPALISVLARPDEVMGPTQQMVEEAMKRGGPRAAVEAFARFVAGDENFEKLNPELRERMLDNGETLFGIEFGAFESYRPDDATLAAVEVPVQVMVGTDSAPFFGEAARWLTARLGVEMHTLPGGHAPYLDRPEDVAEGIRPFLRQAS